MCRLVDEVLKFDSMLQNLPAGPDFISGRWRKEAGDDFAGGGVAAHHADGFDGF